MRNGIIGFMLGAVLVTVQPVAAEEVRMATFAEILVRISGSLSSTAQAQWKHVYWAERAARAQERQVRLTEQIKDRLGDQSRALRDLNGAVRDLNRRRL